VLQLVKAFSELLGTPQRVFTAGSDRQGFTAIAGLSTDKSRATVLISNFAHGPGRYALALKNLPWSGKFTCETSLLAQLVPTIGLRKDAFAKGFGDKP